MSLTELIPQLLRPYSHILVGGKIDAKAIAQAKAEGISRIIDLLPETERAGFDEATTSAALDIIYVNLPIASAADLTHENVVTFDRLLADEDRHITLVHCASGNRVGALFALRASWLQGLPFAKALQVGRHHGLRELEVTVTQLLLANST